MKAEDIEFLRSDVGQAWLTVLGQEQITDQTHLGWAMRLRQMFSAEKTHALLETVILRQRAERKFSRANAMYFDRAGLEMSSAEVISAYRATKYMPFATVADLGCGIGGDALSMAATSRVVGVDCDAARLLMAEANVEAYKHGERFQPRELDLRTMQPFSAEAVFFDPARRTARGKRIHRIAEYQPPISLLERWRPITQNWGIKISPGFNYDELPVEAHVELISVAGELREAIFWYGELCPPARRTATLIASNSAIRQLSSEMGEDSAEITPPKAYLYEPDPAIIRAQLVTNLASKLNATQIDETIAYLTSDQLVQTPFARHFTIEAWFPFQLKTLRRYLRERSVGHVVIKKRGSALEPSQLKQQLKLRGSESRTIFLTRVMGNPAVLITH